MNIQKKTSSVETEKNDNNKPKVLNDVVAKHLNINAYKDVDGLSVFKMDSGLWYVEHKERLKFLAFFMLLLFAMLCWFYFIFQYGDYVINGLVDNRETRRGLYMSNLPPHQFYLDKSALEPQLYPVQILSGTGNKKDLIAQIKNNNQSHYGTFKYYFLNNNEKIGMSDGFILPGETKYLVSLGFDIGQTFGGVRLVLEDLDWQRVNPHKYGKWDKFSARHLDFKISDIVFVPGKKSILSEKISLNTLSFSVNNYSSYNYWHLPLIISLYSYSDLVAINRYVLNDFLSNGSKVVNFSWPGNFGTISDIKIIPDLNITENKIYKQSSGEGIEIR